MEGPGNRRMQLRVRRSNRIALYLLVLAFVAFVAFHFLPWDADFQNGIAGWAIWGEVYEDLRDARNLDAEDLLATSGLLAGAFVVVSAPFLWRVLQSSRLAWWIVVTLSGMATVGLSGLLLFFAVFMSTGTDPLGPGMISVIAAQLLNFSGLLLIRRSRGSADVPPTEP